VTLSLALDATPHLFWISSRAAGIVALLTASLAVSLGLLMGTKLTRRVSKYQLRVAHEALSLSTIVALVIHGVTLLGDGFLRLSVLDIGVPLVSSYRTAWSTLGIVGGWGLILLGLSYYARSRIGIERWRVLHRFTALAWILGLVHSLGEGTDAGQVWFLAMIGIAAGPALVLLLWRTSQRRSPTHAVSGLPIDGISSPPTRHAARADASEPRRDASGDWREPLATPRRSH
jgi:sulfoxide reductase heme-binding subunit YedZ